MDLNNRSCPCATGWQCCSNDLCVPEGGFCGATPAVKSDASNAADASTPSRSLQSYCDGASAYRARCYPGEAPRACPSDYACLTKVFTPSVMADAFGCSESRVCNTGDDACFKQAYDKVAAQQDIYFALNCSKRMTECSDEGTRLPFSKLCETPLAAFDPGIRAELVSCLGPRTCGDAKACIANAMTARGCDAF